MSSAVTPASSAPFASALPRSSRRTCPASPCEQQHRQLHISSKARGGQVDTGTRAATQHQPERLQSAAPAASLRSSHSTSPHSTRPRPRRRACRALCGSSSALWARIKKEMKRTNGDPERLAATHTKALATQHPHNTHTTSTLTSAQTQKREARTQRILAPFATQHNPRPTHFWHSLLQYSSPLQAEQRNTAARAWQQAHGGMVRSRECFPRQLPAGTRLTRTRAGGQGRVSVKGR